MATSTPNIPIHSMPLIFEPMESHKTTMIVLHGRGGTASGFAEPFLMHPVTPLPVATKLQVLEPVSNSDICFRDYFPNTKFVFPTAPLRRAAAFNRSLTHQWFDKWSPQQPELKEHLQIPGLRETSAYLHGLLRQEIDIVGAPNVALVGISQGCASSIVATLLWEGEPFGALVGMCGYLPFRKTMSSLFFDDEYGEGNTSANSKDEADDIFERKEEDFEKETRFERAVRWLHEELEIERPRVRSGSPPMQLTPVFMGHGTEDTVILFEHGRLAAELLRVLEVDVEWNSYGGLGHWYSEDMLRDIAEFLKKRKGWDDPALDEAGRTHEPDYRNENKASRAADTIPPL